MKYHLNILLKVVLFLTLNAISAQVKKSKTHSIRLDSLFTELNKYGEFNGNVLVAEDNKIIFCKSFGISDFENDELLNKKSIFNIASVTKQFTAMAIYKLYKENKLSLDDEISKHIPELGFYKGITINHLIHHTSGLPNYVNLFDKNWDNTKTVTNNDVIRYFQKIKPEVRFDSGSKWEYSNTGYLLLASIIERITNLSFNQFLHDRIFKPLKMKNTNILFVHKNNLKEKKIAKVYLVDSSQINYVKKFDGVYGQGRIYSTIRDLLKWVKGLNNNNFIDDDDKKTLFSSSKLNSGKETGYGFGFFVNQDKEYEKYINHSGSWPGYISYIEQHLDNNKTIIILQNNDNRTEKRRLPIEATRKIIYNLKLKKDYRLKDKSLIKYTGTYVNEKNKELKITFKHHSLWTNSGYELIPLSKTKFKVNGFRPEVTYTFNIDNDGTVKSYKFEQLKTGIERTLKRKK